jgi:hypothetical protein
MAAPKKQAKQEEAEVAERVTGPDAVPEGDRKSVETPLGEGAPEPEVVTAADVPKEERTGSVLPYRIDDIDVDSYDARTAQQIQDAKDAEEAEDDE